MKINKNLFICFCLIVNASFSQTERDIFDRVDSINSLALRHYNNNDIANSFNYYNESLRLSDSINDSYGNAVANFNLGNIYTQMQEYKKAQNSYTEMLSKAMAIKDNFLIASSYLNIGKMHRDKGQLDDIVSYYKKGLQYALNDEVRDQNNIDKRAHTLFDIRIELANVYIENNQLEDAFTYILRAQNSLKIPKLHFWYLLHGKRFI